MPDFQGQADKEEVFKLPSALLDARWHDPAGFVNGASTLEVRTAFVGDGSPIQVTLKGRDGGVLEKIQGKVYGGLFRKRVALSDKTAGGVFFEVELPEHGLKSPGPGLKVGGAIKLTDPKWKDAATGKPVSLLKRLTEVAVEIKADGVPDGSEAMVIFRQKLGENRITDLASIPAQVREGRISLAWIFDYRKDAGTLSSKQEKERTAEEYQAPKMYFEASCLGTTVKGPEADFLDWVRFSLLDEDALPMAKRKIRLAFPDGKTKDAETDEQGNVFVEDVSPGKFTLELIDT